jgi:hypothetical protein
VCLAAGQRGSPGPRVRGRRHLPQQSRDRRRIRPTSARTAACSVSTRPFPPWAREMAAGAGRHNQDAHC